VHSLHFFAYKELFLIDICLLSELLNYMWNFESSDGSNYGGILTALPFDGNSGVWWPHPNDSIPSHSFRLIQAYYCFGINHARWELGMDERLGHLDEPDFRVRNARVIRRAKNWPTFDLERPWIQLMFLLVALLYGGLHCLGWNSEFSSDVQQLLWRISSLIIIGAGAPVLFCYFLLGKVTYDFAEGEAGTLLSMYGPRWLFYVYKALKPVLKNGEVCIDWLSTIPIGNLLIGTMAMLLLAYLFARIYLVVECFIQLFHLPPGPDFIQPSWSTYFPHIG
jgi:hypothetical protein